MNKEAGNEKKRILFMGTPEYAQKILQRLIKESGMELVGVYTQPDRPVGRKKTMTPPPVKVTAEAANIPVCQPLSLKEEGIAEEIAAQSPDFIVVAAYGQLLPRAILKIAPCINLHASLLPKYRGASPIQEALLHGDAVTGVTAMLMEEGLDSGPILAWRVVSVTPQTRKNELFEKLATEAADLTPMVIKAYDAIEPLPQCDADATYCRKITRHDGRVTFAIAADELYNRFRAYEGWPGIYLENGLKLLEIEPAIGEGEPGRILSLEKDGVIVACGEGAVRIKTVQPPSKKPMDALSYLRGKRLKIADLLL
ncbi:methionyl-tRNA formyltransferase [Hydrogenimonas urashimensis]|uniref:methionyl-tRNA formyltransferase n=1 Tax=Hydrogenimonas urashimensis TaxID=2740515 RepID=UPI0022AA84C6|nr:methionyl-tRNA formyltransferase [Hydrogenimonas urashimensis]